MDFGKIIFRASVWTTLVGGTGIIASAFLSGLPYHAKGAVICLTYVIIVLNVLRIFLRVLPASIALALIFRVAKTGNQEGIAEIPEDFLKAFRALCWTLASVLVIGIVAWIIPFESRPYHYTVVFIVGCLATMFWALHENKGKWWPKILGGVSVGTVLVVGVSFFISSAELGFSKFWLLRVIVGYATNQEMFLFVAGALAVAAIAVPFIPKEYKGVRNGVMLGIPILALTVFLNWKFWGVTPGEEIADGDQKPTASANTEATSVDLVYKAVLTGLPMPHGKYFNVNAGQAVPVTFHKEGFYVTSGRGWIESLVAVKGSGRGQRKFFQDADKHSSEHGGRAPCYYDQEGVDFQFVFRAEADMVILTRAAGSGPCRS